MKAEPPGLELRDKIVSGEIAVDLAPGTAKPARDRAVDRALATLIDFAQANDLVLTAAPSAYAFELGGRDAEGRTRFEIRGRVEGDFLVPAKPEALLTAKKIRAAARKRGR